MLHFSFHSLIKQIKNLPKSVIFFVFFSILVGSIARLGNLFHEGFYLDTVSTQYVWAKAGYEYNYFGFWREFKEFFDYFPGSVLFLILTYSASLPFGGSSHAFVSIMKLFYWISEAFLSVFLAYISYNWSNLKLEKDDENGKKSNLVYAYIVGAFCYLTPAIWFVSGVWGQMDPFVTVFALVGIYFLYQSLAKYEQNKKKQYKNAWLSGIFIGIAFWLKLQTILIVPALVFFYLIYKNWQILCRQIAGFLLISVAILIVPAISNFARLSESILSLNGRTDRMFAFASTFWSMVNYNGSFNGVVFNTFGNFITAKLVAYIIYLGFMLPLGWQILKNTEFGTFCKKLFDQLKGKIAFLNKKDKSTLELQNTSKEGNNLLQKHFSPLYFFLITAFSSSVFFLFFDKMHSRYLHFGIFFALVSLALVGNTPKKLMLWFWVVLLHISYTLNQILVMAYYVGWMTYFRELSPAHLYNLSSFLNLLCTLQIFFWVWEYVQNNQEMRSNRA